MRRSGFALALLIAPVAARAAPIDDLVLANHILVSQGVIDVRGHASIRDPRDPNHFLIARAIPPGLVTAQDIQVFDLDGRLVSGRPDQEAYAERFIHARIYRARADVKAVVHAHARSLIAFSATKTPLRPVMNTAVFIGNRGVPIHDNGPQGAGIHDAAEGDALARTLGDGAALLMHGHGAVTVGASLQSAVGRMVTLDANAQMLIALLSMHVTPDYLIAPPDAAANPGNFAREWDWWAAQEAGKR